MKPTPRQLELPLGGEAIQAPAPPSENAPSEAPGETAARSRAEALHGFLMDATGLAIRLRVTDNVSTILGIRHTRDGKAARLSVHHMFLDAPPEVRQALAQWVRKPKAQPAAGILDAFIRGQRHRIQPRKPRRVRLHTQGRHHDLEAVFRQTNDEWFDGAVQARITWGAWPSTRPRRSIRLGSFSPEEQLIRIHPYLDQAFVPAYVVRFTVYHEMLHAHLGIGEHPSGRRRIHPPEFRTLEARHPDYAGAEAWSGDAENMRRLFRTRRRRNPA